MPRVSRLLSLADQNLLVLPSLLLCDFGNLEREIARLKTAGVQALHLDVMDGNFVPNLTYGLPIVSALRRLTDMPLDTHLMICRPERYVQAFVDAGADMVTVHAEATDKPQAVLEQIRDLGASAGLAFNPSTSLDVLKSCAKSCDLVLVMSVEAGFGGQAFDPSAVGRIREVRSIVGDKVVIEVDGGINEDTIDVCASAGAQWFVAGSAIFKQSDYGQALHGLTRLVTQH